MKKSEYFEEYGEDAAELHQWTPNELSELDTKTLKGMVDQDTVNKFIKDSNPDEVELRDFLIERIL